MPTDYKDIVAAADYADELSKYTQRFILWPNAMNSCQIPVALTWNVVNFLEENEADVSPKRGVYAFAVKARNPYLPPHSYIFYIGETKRGLRMRFREYINYYHRPKSRPHMYHFMRKYYDCLAFYYAEVLDENLDTEKIEASLCDALNVPRVKDDFSAEVKRGMSAWRTS